MRPYVGARDPIGAMATDLHDAYEHAASDYMASNPTGSEVNVALAGDAWVSAINTRVAVRSSKTTAANRHPPRTMAENEP
jgi:hypothetical protein